MAGKSNFFFLIKRDRALQEKTGTRVESCVLIASCIICPFCLIHRLTKSFSVFPCEMLYFVLLFFFLFFLLFFFLPVSIFLSTMDKLQVPSFKSCYLMRPGKPAFSVVALFSGRIPSLRYFTGPNFFFCL